MKNLIYKVRKLRNSKNTSHLHCMAEIGRISPGILHDILNPITGLILYLDLIKETGVNNEIDPIIESGQKLREIIKIIQKDFTLYSEPNSQKINICEIIENVIKLFSHKAKTNNVSINFIRKQTTIVSARRMEIYQIFINLISNALDAFEDIPCRKEKNKISITVIENNGFILIRVTDNGCGISEENISKIFNSNYTTKKNGLGIGLSSTRRIIENELKGNIEYSSKLDEGTICEIKIPIC